MRVNSRLSSLSRPAALVLFVALLLTGSAFRSPSTVARAEGNADGTYAEWRLTGPQGGDVRALVVDPNDPERFYFGTLDGQIYTSSDGGRSWRLLSNLYRPRLFIDHIIVDPRNSKILYVAAHRHKDPGGFFKSVDGGITWREASDFKNEALHSMTQSSQNPNIMLVGTISGIFRSTDSGENWTQLPTSRVPGLVDVESLAMDPRNSNVIYAGTWYLPYKSTDGGQTWRSIKTGMIDDSDIFAIDIDPRNPDHVIASACSGIYDTRDGGDNWHKVQGIPSQSRRTRAIMQHPSLPGVVFAGTTEGFWRSAKGGENNSWMVTTSRQIEINSIAVHPRNPNTIFIGTNNYGVMISYDAGKNFTPSNAGYSGRFVNSIMPDRVLPNRIYATTINTATGGGFFFVSTDGGMNWQPSMHNMPPRLIGYSVLQDERDPNLLYLATNLGVYRSPDRGASWTPIAAIKQPPAPRKRPAARRVRPTTAQARTGSRPVSTPAPNAAVPADVVRRAQDALDRAGYDIGTADGQMGSRTLAAIKRFQTDHYLPVSGRLDAGTLTALGIGAGGGGPVGSHVASLSEPINALERFVDRTGAIGIMAATNSGLYRTLDPSRGWDRVMFGQAIDSRTTCVSTEPQNSSTIWVGTAIAGILVSHDGGESWQRVSGVPTSAPINTIVQDPKRPAYLYVGTKQAFYMSHDGGEHWTRRGGNLPFGDYSSILVSPRNSDEVFVGNAFQNGQNGEIGGGVYRSTDAGQTWNRMDSRGHRLPSMRIWALAFDPRTQSTLLVGSHSAGVYVVPRSAENISNGNQR